MSKFTQEGRSMRAETVLGPDTLLLQSFKGTETLSAPFEFEVDLLSTDAEIDAEALLRSPLSLRITTEDEEERTIHGLIRRVTQLGQVDGLTSYRLEMAPWLWFLGLNRDSRIFQQMTVLDIIEKVFTDRGQGDFDVKCIPGAYPVIDYCVQYRESDLAFVQRLCEREGIFYFFDHHEDRHVMVLADNNAAFQASPFKPNVRLRGAEHVSEEVLTDFQRDHSVYVGRISLDDYDYLEPTIDVSGSHVTSFYPKADEGPEFYDYPGAYAKSFCNDGGSLLGEAERYARLRLELQESRRHRASARGNCRGLLLGYKFQLEEHYRSDVNIEYVVVSISHVGRAGDYRSATGESADYRAAIEVLPADTPFRPELRTPRPVVEGTQTALVVGPSDHEIWTDRYGRVKVQFHWDREGEGNDASSCWIRVSTTWGGKNYGSISLPRIGNEVVVAFLEGDPDQPLVVGSVYNADQMPPFDLPASGIQMGIKSRSSMGGGGYNEISITDTKGKEQITVHAQFDQSTVVEHDQQNSIGRDRSSQVGANDAESVGKNQSTQIGENQDLSVGGDQAIVIAGSQGEQVGRDRADAVGGSEERTVGGGRSVTIGEDDELTVGGSLKYSADGSVELTAKKIVLKAGRSTIEMDSGGITIKSGGKVVVKGSKVNVN